MSGFRKSTVTVQATDHMRERILSGQWKHSLPGRDRLAVELGVSHMTIGRALAQLEEEGLVISQGEGLPRLVAERKPKQESRVLHIAVLRFEAEDTQLYFVVDFVHQLREAGHYVAYADKTMSGLNMDVKRVAKLVNKIKADAWIVISGSKPILQWFAAQPFPCFGLFGQIMNLPIAGAGPRKKSAYEAAARRLVELGHKRIVLLSRWAREIPHLNVFYEALKTLNVPVGDYNMPCFNDTPEDLQRCLSSLFATTPPTAIVAMNSEIFMAVQQFVARRNLLCPERVSIMCGDPDPSYIWCIPSIAHISWESEPWVRRIVRWADNISKGKSDTRQTITNAEFVDGGTFGRAPR